MPVGSVNYSSVFYALDPLKAKNQNLPHGQEKPFPTHWGSPPHIQTCDWTQLPSGFGYGSSTLKNWIYKNIRRDNPGLKKNFPAKWGSPPDIHTCDWVQLPAGFGMGSSTLKSWILEKLEL